MKKYDLVAISICLIICLIGFLTSNNLFVGLGIFVVFLAYYFLFMRKKIKAYIDETSKIHCCYHFISSFLITLSVKDSLDDAFESGTRNANEHFQLYLNEMQEMNINEKIEYLNKYFHFNVYRMFSKVVNLYVEQGGNVLKLSDSLLNENTRIEETMNASSSIGKKKTVEFAILWALAFLVVLFMRFALANFYLNMLKSNIFLILLVAFFLIFLVSVHFYLMRFIKLPVKEESVGDE